MEGIYRIPGKMALIQQVVQQIEQDEITFEFDSDNHDVHTVAGVLKVLGRNAIIPCGYELMLSAVVPSSITRAAPAH